MNPFVNPEFWLSLSFFVVLGFIILPPVRKVLHDFFEQKKSQVTQQIQEAKVLEQQAIQTHKKMAKDLKAQLKDEELEKKIKAIQKEFSDKEKTALILKKQDFQVRQNLLQTQTKKRISKQLLDTVEEHVFKNQRASSKDVSHFIQALHEQADDLKKAV